MLLSVFFFFSSRRRHTRCSRDWSSDVCSSDLGAPRGSGEPDRGAGGESRAAPGRGDPGRPGECRAAVARSRQRRRPTPAGGTGPRATAAGAAGRGRPRGRARPGAGGVRLGRAEPLVTALVAGLVRLLAATWRYRVQGGGHVTAARAGGPPGVYVLWHSRILPLPFHRRKERPALL